MKTCQRYILSLIVVASVMPAIAVASDFDGSKTLLCASQEAMDVAADQEVIKGLPADVGAPTFMRIDFAKRAIVGAKRTTPIRSIDKDENQIQLQGTELAIVWTLVLDKADGTFTGTLVGRSGAIVLFGSCEPV